MKRIFLLVAVLTAFISCSKSDGDNGGGITPPGVQIVPVTRIDFSFPDASGNPTRIYAQNSNTGVSPFVINAKSTGMYTLRFSGLGGRPITGTPRPGSTNVVTFDPGLGDTIILIKNGVEAIKAYLINDNLNPINGYISVARFGSETNQQAGNRINTYTTGAMLTQRFEDF